MLSPATYRNACCSLRPLFNQQGKIPTSYNSRWQWKRYLGRSTVSRSQETNEHETALGSNLELLTTTRGSNGVFRLLTNEQRELLEEQRELTRRANKVADELQLPSATADTVSQLESLFSIVVAGEFSAGKSTFINALLGHKLLEMGPLPTTDSITIVTGGKDSSDNGTSHTTTHEQGGVIVHRLAARNIEFLKDLMLVDTPGTNTLAAGHEYRTKRWLPHADLILFVVSADRPFSESERSFLQSIQKFRKRIVVIINKMDVLESVSFLSHEYVKMWKNATHSVSDGETFVGTACAPPAWRQLWGERKSESSRVCNRKCVVSFGYETYRFPHIITECP